VWSPGISWIANYSLVLPFRSFGFFRQPLFEALRCHEGLSPVLDFI
jgi:hypothetical protein